MLESYAEVEAHITEAVDFISDDKKATISELAKCSNAVTRFGIPTPL